MILKLANSMKDGAIAIGLRSYLNERFGEFGEILDCELDSSSSRFTLHARLKGERDTVSATIERYELEREGERVYIVLKSFSSSRQWLTTLLQKLLAGKRYPLPAAVGKLL
ncbi:MAG TPA: hypothetical protein VFV11_05305 [Solimonas sp.]|jgi:hypothetical protein|nr:hypothetical protein [Solimonas sp.]